MPATEKSRLRRSALGRTVGQTNRRAGISTTRRGRHVYHRRYVYVYKTADWIIRFTPDIEKDRERSKRYFCAMMTCRFFCANFTDLPPDGSLDSVTLFRGKSQVVNIAGDSYIRRIVGSPRRVSDVSQRKTMLCTRLSQLISRTPPAVETTSTRFLHFFHFFFFIPIRVFFFQRNTFYAPKKKKESTPSR